MKIKKILLLCFFICSLILVLEVKVNANTNDGLVDKAKSAVLIDEQTGKILYEKNKDFRLAPASMTKIMSLAIIFDYIKAGNLKLTDMIVTSEHAKSMEGTKIFLDTGEKMSLEDMIKGITIASANDATVAVAEKIAGSEGLFVELMNNKVKELGLTNTNFKDSTGLESKDHYTSAYDMAMMSKYLLNNHKEILAYTNLREDYLRKDTNKPFWLVNTNKLIGRHDGIDGLKTGWTQAAGYCLTSTMHKDGHRLISVVMGYEVATIRNSQTVELLNYGFANFRFNEVLQQHYIVLEIKDIKYKPSTFNIVTARKVVSIERLNDKKGEYTFEIKLNELKSTYEANEKVGEYLIYYDGQLHDTVDLIVLQEITTNNLFELVLKIMRLIFT